MFLRDLSNSIVKIFLRVINNEGKRMTFLSLLFIERTKCILHVY